MFLVTVHGSGDSPEVQLFADRVSIATVLLWAAMCAVIIYGDVHLFSVLK
jgi:hypothetical protein